MENLNKENFFNQIYEKYPKACKKFCDWIDEYKKKNNWPKLFANDLIVAADDVGVKRENPIRFHNIPIEMQVGILFKFFSQNKIWDMFDIDDIENIEQCKAFIEGLFNELEDELSE